MNFKKFAYTSIAIIAAVVAMSSCKKSSETTLEYLSGSLKIVGSEKLIAPGTTLNFTATGLKDIDDLYVGYKWSVTGKEKADTVYSEDGAWSYTFPEEIGTYTVTCGTTCEGYYSSTATASVTVVKDGPDGTLPEIYDTEATATVADSDGNEYIYTTIGGNDWMTRNLGVSGSGLSYIGASIMDNIIGRYYSYDEAVEACSSLGNGWKLPSDADWMAVAQTLTSDTLEAATSWAGVAGGFMTYATLNGNTMWEFWPKVKVTNETGLMVVSAGYADRIEETFEGTYKQAAFWTSDEYAEDSNKALVRYFVVDQPDLFVMAAHKDAFAATVRCVRSK